MPEFWEKFPEEKQGNYSIWVDVIPFSFVGTRYRKWGSKGIKSLQKAYLKARLRALIYDFLDSSENGIDWTISNRPLKNK